MGFAIKNCIQHKRTTIMLIAREWTESIKADTNGKKRESIFPPCLSFLMTGMCSNFIIQAGLVITTKMQFQQVSFLIQRSVQRDKDNLILFLLPPALVFNLAKKEWSWSHLQLRPLGRAGRISKPKKTKQCKVSAFFSQLSHTTFNAWPYLPFLS